MSTPPAQGQAAEMRAPAAARGTFPAPNALVCVVVDPVFDFMHKDGAFAAKLGSDDTAPVRAVADTLADVVAACGAYGAATVLVRSSYKDNQFSIPNLCVSDAGKALCLPRVSQGDFTFQLVKQTNSLLDCGGKQRRRLLDMVSHATVLLTGVTTTSCVKAAVEALRGRCRRVVVAADAVAVRAVATARGASLLTNWRAEPTGEVGVVDSWRDLLPARVHGGSAELTPDAAAAVAAVAERCAAPVPRALVPYALGEATPRLLYIVNGSIPSWRVLLAMHEGGVDFEAVRMFVMSRPRPTRTPQYLAVNPRGQTPVLLEGDAVVRDGQVPGRAKRQAPGAVVPLPAAPTGSGSGLNTRESLAILAYLQRHVDATSFLLPADPSQAAWALALMQESERLRLLLDPVEDLFDTGFADETPPKAAGEAIASMAAILRELRHWDTYAQRVVVGTPPGVAEAQTAYDTAVASCVEAEAAANSTGDGTADSTATDATDAATTAPVVDSAPSSGAGTDAGAGAGAGAAAGAGAGSGAGAGAGAGAAAVTVTSGFLAGTARLSVADCAVFPVLAWLVRHGLRLAHVAPHLGAYFAMMTRVSSVRRSTPLYWDTWSGDEKPGFDLWSKGQDIARMVRGGQLAGVAVSDADVPLVLEVGAMVSAQVAKTGGTGPIGAARRTRQAKTKASDALEYDPAYYHEHEHGPEKPLTGLAAGDTRLLFDVLPDGVADIAFEAVRDEVQWHHMYHRGGAVPRLVAIQGAIQPNGSQPLYRHPADEQPVLVPFTAEVDRIRRRVETVLQQPINHALIQWYKTGTDYISQHADKTLDIARDSDICNISLGASRSMILRNKRDTPKEARGRNQRVCLPHNSLFVLGWESNKEWTHEIRRDKRRPAIKRPDEKREGGQRISITFRHVATYLRPDGRAYGQGAPFKTEEDLEAAIAAGIDVPAAELTDGPAAVDPATVQAPAPGRDFDGVADDAGAAAGGSSGDAGAASGACGDSAGAGAGAGAASADASASVPAAAAAMEADCMGMLHAFSQENRDPKFDWDAAYGHGFSVINMKIINPH